MKTQTLILAALLVALPLSGCVQNMADLKDRMGAGEEPVQTATVDEQPTLPAAANNTTPPAPPVARITVFGANGALVYKSTFQAEDATDIVFVDKGTTLNLIGSDSEALARGAEIATFAWTVDGKAIEGGRQATFEVAEPALHVVKLSVTDTNGETDNQSMRIAVAPEPYEVVIELMTGPVAGAEGVGAAESVGFTIAADPEKPAKVQKVVVSAAPDITLDGMLAVFGPEGNVLGSSDSAGHSDLDQTETVELGALAFGDYTAEVSAFAGIDADGVPVTVTITFLPVVEGLDAAGDGHGHAH